jgi:hypothetical protein
MSDDEQAVLEFSRRTMAEIVRGWGEKINFTTTLDEAAARLTIVATRVPTGEIQEVLEGTQETMGGTSQGHHLHLPIGNTACTHNAESPHLRCAVNPCGPCEGCPEFEVKS